MAELPIPPRAELTPQPRESVAAHIRTIAETERSASSRATIIRNLSPKHRMELTRGRDSAEVVVENELDNITRRAEGVENQPQLPGGEERKRLIEDFKQTLRDSGVDLGDRTLPLDKLAQAYLAENNIVPEALLRPPTQRTEAHTPPSTEVAFVETPPRETVARQLRKQVEEVVSAIKKKTERGQPASTVDVQQLQEATDNLNRRVALVEEVLVGSTTDSARAIEEFDLDAPSFLRRAGTAGALEPATQPQLTTHAQIEQATGYPFGPRSMPLTDRIRANEAAQGTEMLRTTPQESVSPDDPDYPSSMVRIQPAGEPNAQVTTGDLAANNPAADEQRSGFFRQRADQLREWTANQQAARTSPTTEPIIVTESDIADLTRRSEPTTPATDETARWNRFVEDLRQPWYADREGMIYVPQLRMTGDARKRILDNMLGRFSDVNFLEDWKRTRQAGGEATTLRAYIEQREQGTLTKFDETLAREREEHIRRQMAIVDSTDAHRLFDARLTPDHPYYQRTINLFQEEADAVRNNLSQLWEQYAKQRAAQPDTVSPEDSAWIDQMASEMQPYVTRRTSSQSTTEIPF